jgi:hypothetical protein
MTFDTKLTGDISEKIVELQLLRLGMNVLRPVGDRLPYDLAIDISGKLIRIQVRTAWYDKRNDYFIGNVRDSKTNRKIYKYVKSNTIDVDFFVFVAIGFLIKQCL